MLPTCLQTCAKDCDAAQASHMECQDERSRFRMASGSTPKRHPVVRSRWTAKGVRPMAALWGRFRRHRPAGERASSSRYPATCPARRILVSIPGCDEFDPEDNQNNALPAVVPEDARTRLRPKVDLDPLVPDVEVALQGRL